MRPDKDPDRAGLVRRYALRRWGTDAARFAARGGEYDVYRIDAKPVPVAVKIARSAVISDDIDDAIDTAAALGREAEILAWLAPRGVPVPAFRAFDEFEGVALLAMDFVEGPRAPACPERVGDAVRRVHEAAPCPALSTGEEGFLALFAEVLEDRIRKAGRMPGGAAGELPRARIAALVGRYRPARLSVLHMDLRPANVLAAGGDVRILDWSNSITGDPWLDLLRAEEYGEFDMARFRHGYGPLPPAPPESVELLYRLYTTAMLAILFHRIAPDPERQRASMIRTRAILARLGDL